MRPNVLRTRIRRRRPTQSGQTLVIALLIMGVLLALGLVFISIVGRNITSTGVAKNRTVASDLAEAGVRFAHFQLVNSPLGADWRPVGRPIVPTTGVNFSRDPDALYLRPASGFNVEAANRVKDLGGPDGLGSFVRVNYDRGRALVRVRYAPADVTLFESPVGVLKAPGKARNYLIIESVGRAGSINDRDPSQLNREGVQLTGFANKAEFDKAFSRLKQLDVLNQGSRRMIAFASIGITESARFITNKFSVRNPAEIGSLTVAASGEPGGLGITHEGRDVQIVSVYGGTPLGTTLRTGTGTLYSNADLLIHGRQDVLLDSRLGDAWLVNGNIRGANSASQLNLTFWNRAAGAYQTANVSGNALDSRSNSFTTINGVLRDGIQDADPNGYSRGVPRKEPPTIMGVDPATNVNRYIVMTRDSGRIVNSRNSGRFGYGTGVYVSGGPADRADAQDEDERIRLGTSKAPVQDWLNPNKAFDPKRGGWNGPYYIPVAANVRLIADGFIITRDKNSSQPQWQYPTGFASGQSSLRFRLVSTDNLSNTGDVYIINSLANPTLINVPAANFIGNAALKSQLQNEGFLFNGVVYFEGDVQVRGVIPTNQQLTIVSMGTIYVNGSITKGTVNMNGSAISTPSKSMCALLAKDYVCLNTTQFFGLANGQEPRAKDASALRDAPNAIELDATQNAVTLQSQFLLNPADIPALGSLVNDPSSWRPYATNYTEAGTNAPLSSNALFQHAADSGSSFFGLDIAPRAFGGSIGATAYLFDSWIYSAADPLPTFNAQVLNYLQPGINRANVPMYGLTNAGLTQYPKFETISVPLIGSTGAFDSVGRSMSNGRNTFGLQDETEFTIRLTGVAGEPTRNYELARFGVTPFDVRIEATMYAEEGSFFVIPGPPFNFNRRDLRSEFEANVTALGLQKAQQYRYEQYGSMPEVPFYGEPLNCRISIIGAISENMPAPIAQQAEWQRRWGWMPRQLAGTGKLLPSQHVPAGYDVVGNAPPNVYVPNLTLNYDPALALGTASGNPDDPLRRNAEGQVLPPAPRLPVSSKLLYFGEANP